VRLTYLLLFPSPPWSFRPTVVMGSSGGLLALVAASLCGNGSGDQTCPKELCGNGSGGQTCPKDEEEMADYKFWCIVAAMLMSWELMKLVVHYSLRCVRRKCDDSCIDSSASQPLRATAEATTSASAEATTSRASASNFLPQEVFAASGGQGLRYHQRSDCTGLKFASGKKTLTPCAICCTTK
jgi:hypothetical protein